MSKICRICKEEKPLSEFYFRKAKKAYETRCNTCESIRKKKWEEKNWPKRMIVGAKSTDRKKFNNVKTVTKKFILNQQKLQNNKCFYCDCEMQYGFEINRSTNPKGVTLERISSNLPHINSNCVLICSECNKMKNSTEFRKFVEKCTHISNKFKYVFD